MGRGLWALAAAVAAVASLAGTASSARPLETAVFPEQVGAPPVTFPRIAAAGATKVRLILNWRNTAPSPRPAGFDAADPGDPAYRWAAFDKQVRLSAEAGLEPIVTIFVAPAWASGSGGESPGIVRPDPKELARFARAAVTRYGGSFKGLPRVRYWQVWNEPNLEIFLSPQYVGQNPFSPTLYRRMTNRFYDAVKSVHPDNLVVAGGTAPFHDATPVVFKVNPQWGPLTFMRELLCLSRSLEKTCTAKTAFDVWAHHPYTSGGPTRAAHSPDDVSLGDLPEMRRVLRAAWRARTIRATNQPLFWVTEFSWDTAPPDPKAVPAGLQARWVAEGLHVMWQAGVSLVTWFSLRDEPRETSPYQSGLYFRGATPAQDRPKPALAAFRFPFVAYKQGPSLTFWGRTPGSQRGRVAIEQKVGSGWRRLSTLSAKSLRHLPGQAREAERRGRRPGPPRSHWYLVAPFLSLPAGRPLLLRLRQRLLT